MEINSVVTVFLVLGRIHFSEHRWAVTGTPIQNKVKDFFSLIKFLRLAPFDDYRVWREAVDKRGECSHLIIM